LFESNFNEVYAEIEFIDSITRKAVSLPNLLAFENSPKRRIKTIEFCARDPSLEKRGMLRFRDDKYRPIDLSVSGDADFVTKFGHQLDEMLDGLKPWYSMICKVDFFYVIGFACFLIYALLTIIVPDAPKDKVLELSKGIKILAILLSSFALIALLIWVLNKFISKFFPLAFFSIGQGVERYKVLENFRWCVLVAFVVSLAASALYAFVT
jgi:flagellar biogenesis protein FliO